MAYLIVLSGLSFIAHEAHKSFIIRYLISALKLKRVSIIFLKGKLCLDCYQM
jgi:hypothetical protein